MRLRTGRRRVRILAGEIFLFSRTSRPALGPTQPSEMGTGVKSAGT